MFKANDSSIEHGKASTINSRGSYFHTLFYLTVKGTPRMTGAFLKPA